MLLVNTSAQLKQHTYGTTYFFFCISIFAFTTQLTITRLLHNHFYAFVNNFRCVATLLTNKLDWLETNCAMTIFVERYTLVFDCVLVLGIIGGLTDEFRCLILCFGSLMDDPYYICTSYCLYFRFFLLKKNSDLENYDPAILLFGLEPRKDGSTSITD